MRHSFESELAVEIGILPAVILNNIAYWTWYNETNGTNFHDGSYWTYNSNKAFKEQFPYASSKQIRNAIDKLRNDGFIRSGMFNDNPYDKTLWYTLTEKGKSRCLYGHIDVPLRANRDAPEGKSTYTNIKHIYKNTYNNKTGKKSKCEVSEVLDSLPDELREVAEAFVEHRKVLKSPMSGYALKLAINKAKKLAHDDIDTTIAIINQSIQNGWKGVFELSGRNRDEGKAGITEDKGNASGGSSFYEDIPDVW